MLVRDIELRHAILDLTDNAVDGARRVERATGNTGDDLSNYRLKIEVSPNEIAFSDNCGGISLAAAEEYAFKFGRPRDIEGLEHSIGQFGVGMKRAFFKLGERIDLTSTTESSQFRLHLRVDEWRKEAGWNFKLVDVVDGKKQRTEAIGTQIEIQDLLPGVQKELGLPNFPHDLLDELNERHREAISAGFDLTVNSIAAQESVFVLLASPDIVPAYQEYQHTNGGDPVRVRIACGIAGNMPGTAGWDVVCNGRMVLKSDQSPTTGWRSGGDTVIPAFHGQFSLFRGMVAFDSTDASRVPWTTTKTGLDEDSSVWREAKDRMILAMRPVIDFLNALDRELDLEAAKTAGETLAAHVERASPKSLAELAPNPTFQFPRGAKAPRAGRIGYSRPKPLIDRAKKTLGVTTAREVGEHSFDYWVASELDPED